MYRHPYFNLTLHDDRELAAYLGAEVLGRETLHEWPLSCVQRVTTAQGEWIYKSQFGPTVEAAFYRAARSALLSPVRVLYQADGDTCTLRAYVDAPLIEALDLTEDKAARMARQLRAQMDAIEGDLPYLYDIRTPDRWLAFADRALADIAALIEQGRYTATTPDMVVQLRGWAHAEPAIEAIQRLPGHVHGDLCGDNVFVLPDGSYRVIDWQRPFLGPTEVDVASLIDSLGFDPLHYVHPAIVQVRCFVLIQWVTVCATRWFPEATEHYDRLTAEQVSKIQSIS
ncbi:MAG: aminoglycoside phosphotransferase family protein [Anaerolineae bacterium]|nr:aminoglycoside phosphotransferase family protein [Anaerolineae bacterium]